MWPWVFIELYLKNICAISLQMHAKKNPYEVFFPGIVFLLLYCSLQYAHTGTWLTLIKKKKNNRVNEIYSWSRGFLFRQKFMIKYKSSMMCIYFRKKTWSHNYALLILPIQRVSECESAVPANFLSYAPTSVFLFKGEEGWTVALQPEWLIDWFFIYYGICIFSNLQKKNISIFITWL